MGSAVAEAIVKGFVGGAVGKGVEKLIEHAPRFRIRIRVRKRPIILIFALIADFYEILDYDVVHEHISSLLRRFRKTGDTLILDDVEFRYIVDMDYAEGYDPIGIWLDDIVSWIDLPEIEDIPTPVKGFHLYLEPTVGNVRPRYIVYAAYSLLQRLSSMLLDILDLRVHRISRFACIITGDRMTAQKIYEKISSKLRKSAVNAYCDFYQRPDRRFGVVLSLAETLTRNVLADVLS